MVRLSICKLLNFHFVLWKPYIKWDKTFLETFMEVPLQNSFNCPNQTTNVAATGNSSLFLKSLLLWNHKSKWNVTWHEVPMDGPLHNFLVLSFPTLVARHIVFWPVCVSVTKFVSATPLKLLIRFLWNFIHWWDIICTCAYYQEILIPSFLWELCPFKLKKSS